MVFEAAARSQRRFELDRFSSATRRSTSSADGMPVCARSSCERAMARTNRCQPTGSRKICWPPLESFSEKLMKTAVAIIPARWGSTRFPGKPLHHDRRQAASAARLGAMLGAQSARFSHHRDRRHADRGSRIRLGRGSCADARRNTRAEPIGSPKWPRKLQRVSRTLSTSRATSR